MPFNLEFSASIQCIALTQQLQKSKQHPDEDIFDLYYDYKQLWKSANSNSKLLTLREFEMATLFIKKPDFNPQFHLKT